MLLLPSPGTRQRLLVSLAVGIVLAGATAFSWGSSPGGGGGHGGGGGGSCKKNCDTTPPSVSIVTPSSGADTSGTITVGGSANDNKNVASVGVKVDTGSSLVANGTTSWSYLLDTTAYGSGLHSITATATDPTGNAGSASVTVTFDNGPAPSPSPSPNPSPTPSPSPVPTPSIGPGTLGGWVYEDLNRDGIYEIGDLPLANEQLYMYDGNGKYLGNQYSDATGWYQFGGLVDGSYVVQVAPPSWWSLREAWVPDTTGSILPTRTVTLAGAAQADFGWRQIVRSTDMNTPLSSYTGPNGLTVQSYDDVVAAKDIYDDLMTGSLIGQEAQFVTIRFDTGYSSVTSTSTRSENGTYVWFSATSYIDYDSWLDTGDRTMFHEYGHAWSLYYAYMVQQDPTLTAYLQARGLLGDARVGSNYAWDPKEMIAEDYRELFGTPNAQVGGQINTDIPLAKDVAGLSDFLATTFRSPPP